MSKRKRSGHIIFGLGAIIALIIALALLRPPGAGAPTGKIRVTASFYPMAEFARQVGGDKITVTTMIGPGVEPHDYDPAPGDLISLYKSKLFIYNGAGLEKWIDRIQPDLTANHIASVDASSGLSLRPSDPHVWLDPVLAARQVDNIQASLAQVDPANAAYYRQQADHYKAQLAALDQTFKTGLAACVRRDIITSHQAFGYLGDRYHLNVLAISGLSPDQEPSPQQLAKTAQFARDHHAKYIFFETLVSPKLSDTIAREVGAQTLVFNPLEGLTPDQVKQGHSYLSVQQDNVNNLRIALDCN